MSYTHNDHLAYLRKEKEAFYKTHQEVHLCCWHSIREKAVRWKCCQCQKKVWEQWMDRLDFFQRIGEVRG